MTGAVFVKQYPSPDRAGKARAHWAWLAGLESGVRLPLLRSAAPHELAFEHLGSRQPSVDDIGALAQALGTLHAAAHSRHLHATRLDEPFPTQHSLTITDFVTPRRAALETMPVPVTGLPVALYKDANIRNFLLTADGVAIVDFDDLTLAPFGYDLAKLVVSTAMTHGRLDPHVVEEALETYNSHTAESGPHATCSMQQLRVYAELHHLFTAPYVHRNGYRHSWRGVRPWPEPKSTPMAAVSTSSARPRKT